MNILQWLKDCGGKMALSALQTAGLATVVGVAGLGAYSFLSAPAEDPALSPSSYNPGEVVYVAGNPNSGNYQSGAYVSAQDSGSALNESSVRISAKTLNRLNEADRRDQAFDEMEEQQSANYSAPVGPAYKGGATEGLGMGANVANEMGLNAEGLGGNDPMAAVSGMMGNMQGIMNQAQQQAQNAAQGKPSADEKGNAPGLAGLKSSGMATAPSIGGAANGGGNGFNASFTVQNSGKNKGGAGNANMPDMGNVMASAQQQMSSVMDGMRRMQAKASFGKEEGLGSSRDADIMNVNNTKGGKELKLMMKQSAQVAKNKNRAANDGSDPFLSDTKVSGGMQISAENVTTGQGQGSKDFETDANSSLRGIQSWGDDAQLHEDKVKAARDRLRQMMWTAIPTVLALSVAIAGFLMIARSGFWGWWAYAVAAGLTVLALVTCALLITTAVQYIKIRGSGSSLSTWGIVTGGVLIAITGAAWIPGFAIAKKKLQDMALKKLIPLFATLAGLGAVGGAMSAIQGGNAVKEGSRDIKELKNTELDSDSK